MTDTHKCDAIAKVTCGNCGNSWCERCDPCPSALCHWCHGRGVSTAPLGISEWRESMSEGGKEMYDKIQGEIAALSEEERADLLAKGYELIEQVRSDKDRQNAYCEGDKVTVDGKYDGVIEGVYIEPTGISSGMFDVKLERGTICISGQCIKLRRYVDNP